MPSTQPKAPKQSTQKGDPRHEHSHPAKSAKAPRSTEEQLRRHFTSLCAQVEGGFFKNAIKSCDRILRLFPDDAEALQTKLFLLIQTDQYALALEMLETSSSSSSSQRSSSQFERAYVLYRLHREQEAEELLGNMSGSTSDRGVQHLDAQLKFRDHDYYAAHDVYNGLLNTCSPDTDEYQDILVNLEAAQTHIDFLEKDYLKGVHALPSTQSASALEALPAPSIVSTLATVTNISGGASSTPKTSEPPAVNAPRKSRIPKHVVLGMTPPPDPERWLKKRERTSTHRHDGRKRGHKAGMGIGATQGSAVSDPIPASNVRPTSGGGQAKKGKKGK